MGGQRIRLKPDSVPTKFIFAVEKPKRKKPADRASLDTKKTNIEVAVFSLRTYQY